MKNTTQTLSSTKPKRKENDLIMSPNLLTAPSEDTRKKHENNAARRQQRKNAAAAASAAALSPPLRPQSLTAVSPQATENAFFSPIESSSVRKQPKTTTTFSILRKRLKDISKAKETDLSPRNLHSTSHKHERVVITISTQLPVLNSHNAFRDKIQFLLDILQRIDLSTRLELLDPRQAHQTRTKATPGKIRFNIDDEPIIATLHPHHDALRKKAIKFGQNSTDHSFDEFSNDSTGSQPSYRKKPQSNVSDELSIESDSDVDEQDAASKG